MRTAFKRALATLGAVDRGPAFGATLLIWHRVGGRTSDELDTPLDRFEAQLDAIESSGVDVLTLDAALDRLDAGDPTASVVLTFDDGFDDLPRHAHPALARRRLPYTIYVAAGLVGGRMQWEGSTGGSQGALAMNWTQLVELHDSGLVTVGNHTWNHPVPSAMDDAQLDRCSDAIASRLGESARPRHFAWTWGVEVPSMRAAVAERFRSAATGVVGRNAPGCDLLSLRRVPVRRTDPLRFFEAKLRGNLLPERMYGRAVALGKAIGRRA